MKHFKAQRVRATRWEWREGSLSCTPASLAPGAMPTEQSEFALPRAIAAHAVPCDPYAEPSDFVPDTQFMPWKEVPPPRHVCAPMHEPAASNLEAPPKSGSVRSMPSSLIAICTPWPVYPIDHTDCTLMRSYTHDCAPYIGSLPIGPVATPEHDEAQEEAVGQRRSSPG